MMTFSRATPFDCGSGAVNPKAALDPGLVLDASKFIYVCMFFSKRKFIYGCATIFLIMPYLHAIRSVKLASPSYSDGSMIPFTNWQHILTNFALFVLAAHEDYITFLCSIPDVNHSEVSNIAGASCNSSSKGQRPFDLNIPSIAISQLRGTETVKRTVTSVSEETETYTIMTRMPPEIALDVTPATLTVLPGASREITATLTARSVTGTYSFGEITMKGDRGHLVRIPVVDRRRLDRR
jgi:hypothetical protein